jgi:hypothetical protein
MNLLGHWSGQGTACQALNFNRLAGIWPAFGENWFLAGRRWANPPAKIARTMGLKAARRFGPRIDGGQQRAGRRQQNILMPQVTAVI